MTVARTRFEAGKSSSRNSRNFVQQVRCCLVEDRMVTGYRSLSHPLNLLRDQKPSTAPRNGPEQTRQEYTTAAFVATSGPREVGQLVKGNPGGAPCHKSHRKCKRYGRALQGRHSPPAAHKSIRFQAMP